MSEDGNHLLPTGRTRWRPLAAAAALLLLTATATGCAGSSDDGESGGSSASTTEAPTEDEVTDLLGEVDRAEGEPIKIGMLSDGATEAFDNSSEFDAAKATADFWNEHKGGVAGRPVEIVECATKGDPAGGTDCANQFVQDGVVAVALSQSSVTESVWPPIHEAGVPIMLLGANGNDLLEDPDTTYNLNNGNGTLFSVPVSVAKTNDIDKVTFVVIDVPQALTSFESVGPALLDANGIDYELVKVPAGTADMTSQMQQVANGDSGLVHVIGNDSFCIAAFNGLADAAFDGEVSSINQCITANTREQAAPEILDGMYVTALTTVGDTEDPGFQLYDAVMREYSEVDTAAISEPTTMQAYTTVSALLTSLAGLEGEVDKDTVNEAIKAMEESEIPGAGGMLFKCDGTASEQYASVCSSQTLSALLDAEGNAVSYELGEALSSGS